MSASGFFEFFEFLFYFLLIFLKF